MFEFMRSDGITERAYMLEVYAIVQRNMGYICSLDKAHADEIAEKIITHAVTHRNRDKKDTLNAYVRSLANSFVKELHSEQNRNEYLDDMEGGGYNIVADVMAWTSHEISYDVDGRKHLVDLMMTQYLIMPNIVTRYCANALRAAQMEPAIVVPQEDESDILNGIKWKSVESEFRRYSPATVLLSMIEMAQYIAKQQRLNTELRGRVYKPIAFVPVVGDRITNITEKPTVVSVDANGTKRFYAIDPYTFEMHEVDGLHKLRMDFEKWQPIGSDNSVRCVYSVDISELMNYLYEQVCVPYGVDTKYIRWVGKERNIKFLPSGTTLYDVNEENYFIEVRAEILTMLADNPSIDILGITSDYVYLRPVRRLMFNAYRCKLFNGKVIDLPIQVKHMEKIRTE